MWAKFIPRQKEDKKLPGRYKLMKSNKIVKLLGKNLNIKTDVLIDLIRLLRSDARFNEKSNELDRILGFLSN